MSIVFLYVTLKDNQLVPPCGIRQNYGGVYALKIQESAENYLETILMLGREKPYVRSIDIANELNFSKPSVSVAMKNLHGYITLTAAGQSIADTMYERHTMLSNWLIYLGVDARTAAEDACRMEHVLSADTFEALKRHITQGHELPEDI